MWLRRHFLFTLVPALFGQGVVRERAERKPNIVLISGETELGSEKFLSKFAELLEGKHGMRCSLVTLTSPTDLDVGDSLESADLSIWFLSGLRLPAAQLAPFQEYARGDKPLIVLGGTLDGFLNWLDFRKVASKKGSRLFSFSSVDLTSESFRSTILDAVYAGLGRQMKAGGRHDCPPHKIWLT